MSGSFPVAYGKYILVQPLARGGMGEISLALSGDLGGFEKLCVIKKVRPDRSRDSLVRRFLDEAKVVVKLSHGNLVQVFDAGKVGDEVYIAMEYVEGRDLRDMMIRCEQTKTRTPPEVAMHLVIQVCRGLQYAHNYSDLQLVHRDVCPANVLVSFFGEVKVTDFGLAQSALKEEMTEPGKVYGRVSYLTPEQARRGEVDRRTDIYAMGIILWELLTGQALRPGPHKDPGTMLSMIRAGKVVPPSSVNPRVTGELDEIVIRAMQVKPADRFASAEEMRKALARVLARQNPGFDESNIASFMRHVYGEEVEKARKERERLLSNDYSRLRRPSSSIQGLPSVDVDPDASLSGQLVDGRYRVIGLLGEGGMGAVYEAEHQEIGRRVALKILHAVLSSHPETVKRFRQEARAATRIGHPNIVEVTDSGTTTDGRLFFAMELLSGVDLAEVMSETRIVPARRALRITMQVCKGLHAAHEAGVIHRDLKPENIFLIEREGRGDFVKILDFGVAKNLELAKEGEARLTHPGMAMGTPEYMAPEQAAGQDVDRRIDVYATGGMLYEMLTGHLPHEGKNLMQVLSMKASTPPVPPSRYRPEIPTGLEDVLLKALAADRDARYLDMEELSSALRPYTALGAMDWAEAVGPASPPRPILTSSQQGCPEIVPGRSRPSGTPIETDPTVPLLGENPFVGGRATPAPGARLVVAGDVQLSDDVQSIERSRMAMDDPDRAHRLATGSTYAYPVITEKRRWPLVLAGVITLGLVAAAAVIFWPGAPKPPATMLPDARVPDQRARTPDAAPPASKPAKPKKIPMGPDEVSRLVEWARRAADGRRYTRPRGDNVRELLRTVEADHPGHPEVIKLRKVLCRRLMRRARRYMRRRRYRSAEKRIKRCLSLDDSHKSAQASLVAVNIYAGHRLLRRRRYKPAVKRAKAALQIHPESVGALELLGDIAWRRRRYTRALKHYQLAIGAPRVRKRQRRTLKKKIKRVKQRMR